MKTPVLFQVYLQALGGKFLGPNAFDNTNIKVSLKYSLGNFPLQYKVIQGTTDDGTISQSFTDGSTSFMPILTMPDNDKGNPAVNYLTPGAKTIVGHSGIFLPDTNEYGTITASIPLSSGGNLVLTQQVLLDPQQLEYRITMVVPGLLLEWYSAVPKNQVAVYVKMMCGCKVTQGLPTSFWTVSDFTVYARVYYKDNQFITLKLVFNTAANDSSFIANLPDAKPISHINYFATQKSTGNYGALVQLVERPA